MEGFAGLVGNMADAVHRAECDTDWVQLPSPALIRSSLRNVPGLGFRTVNCSETLICADGCYCFYALFQAMKLFIPLTLFSL